jgi:DNA-binding transcriptional MerR regulator
MDSQTAHTPARSNETAATGASALPAHAARPGEPGHDADGPTFSITQLAEEFDVTTRAIRFYEDKDLLHPSRDGQTRVYSARDRARLLLIQRGKRVGFSLSEIREIIDLYDLRDGLSKQLVHARGKYEEQIRKLESQRKDIDESIKLLRHGIGFVDGELTKRKSAKDCASSVAPAANNAAAEQAQT